MSTQDIHAHHHTEQTEVDETELIRYEARQQMVLGAANRDRTRTERGVSWAVWHFGELTATTGPLLAAAVIDGRIAWLSMPIAAVWAGREIYQRHRAHTARTTAPQRQTPPADDTGDASGAASAPRTPTGTGATERKEGSA